MKPVIRRERLCWHGGRENLKIAHLSDLHVKWSRARLDHLDAMLREENPGLVLLTGDYYDTAKGARLVGEFLQEIATRYPLYWISGNHDHWHGPKYLLHLQEARGAQQVDEGVHHFESTAGFLYQILSWHTLSQLPSAPPLAEENTRRIVLLHNPEDLGRTTSFNGNLLLAGHLHGGQFFLWHTRHGHAFPANLLYRWCRPRVDLEHGTVIVSRGLGDTVPLRFRCAYEVVCVEIT